MQKTVLITGHSGFIGYHLAKYLKENTDWYLVGCSRNKSKFNIYVDQEIQVDLNDYTSSMEVTKEIDYVIHLAADMGGVGYLSSNIAETTQNSIEINLNILKASAKNKVQKFLFSSSACVYNINLATSSDKKFKEEDAYPAYPDKGYGWAKLFTEQMCSYYASEGLIPEVYLPRFHTIYGPYIDYWSTKAKAPPAITKKVIDSTDTVSIWGDGEQQRSFLYMDDCIYALFNLLNSNFYDPINIGSETSITIRALTQMLIDISGKDIRIEYDLTKPEGPKFRNSDSSKAKEILNFKERVLYSEGLLNMYKWIEQHNYEKNNSVL